MKYFFIFLLAITACTKAEPNNDLERQTEKFRERQECIKLCAQQNLIVNDFTYECRCSKPEEPLANVEKFLLVCSKACNGKMKEATQVRCECLDPHKTKKVVEHAQSSGGPFGLSQ